MAQELKTAREALGMTQAQLAAAVNEFWEDKVGKPSSFTDKRICNFERGERPVSPRVIWFISDAS